MDEDKESKETSSREWEVVSLTASTYAAAPGPEPLESNDGSHGKLLDTNEDEVSRAMFMSGHFVFPPSQHENLPLDINDNETPTDPESEVGNLPFEKSGLDMEEGGKSVKNNEDDWDIKRLNVTDDIDGIKFFDEKGKNLSVHESEFKEDRSLLGLDMSDKEQNTYNASNFSSIQNEEDISGSSLSEENLIILESNDPLLSNQVSPSNSTILTNESKFDESGLPCEAWWKKSASSLYYQAKDSTAVWSVVVAAALMGLVILGRRWQSQQLKWQPVIKDEKMNRILGPMSRFKYAFVTSQQPGSVLKGTVSMGL